MFTTFEIIWVGISCLLPLTASAVTLEVPENMDNYTCCVASYLSASNCLENAESLKAILHCELNKGLSLLDDDCISKNEVAQLIEIGQCMYSLGSGNNDGDYISIPANTSMFNNHTCSNFHRTGTLCGKCIDEYSPFVYSFDMSCVKCPNGKSNWWKFVLAAFLPLTIFYFLILFFKINITSSYLEGFVLYCQVLTMPAIARAVYITLTHSHNMLTLYRFVGTLWHMEPGYDTIHRSRHLFTNYFITDYSS